MTPRAIRVLALDDNPADLDVLRIHLGDLPGWTIEFCGCEDVAQAREELARRAFDLVFIDDRLGRASGLEVLVELRRDGLRAPVIVLAGWNRRETAASAVRAGAVECLDKSSLSSRGLETAMEAALAHVEPALPYRTQSGVQDVFENLSRDIGPTLEAARASLSCVLAEGYLSPEQRVQLGQARELCKRALGDLDDLLDIARTA